MASHSLTPLFSPNQVALIGASDRPGSVGGRVLENLLSSGYGGRVFPVNPRHDMVQGRSCYPDVSAISEAVDLAMIATPAATVPGILEQCGQAGIRAAIIFSAGFAEMGEEGRERQGKVVEIARKHGIRLLGPNCLGLIRPSIGLNATFSKTGAQEGEVALVSQSGALCTAILDWADAQEIGFSAVVSLGDAADLEFGELLDFLALDSRTRSILLYVEGIHCSRSFLSGLRAAARLKPVIVMKSGRHASGMKAAMSHSAAMVGGDNVFDAALQRAGAVRVDSITELFSAARILSGGRDTSGDALAIVTNAGGAGVIAADCAEGHGLQLAELSPETTQALDRELPRQWSRGNPVDVLGDAGADRYAMAIEVCTGDESADALLVMLTPQAMTDPMAVARSVIEQSAVVNKPLLACWMGGSHVEEARNLLARTRIPVFRTPESAIAAFFHMVAYRKNQELLLQVPGPLSERSRPVLSDAREVICSAIDAGRTSLTTFESKQILQAFHVPVNNTKEVRTDLEAVQAAEEIGYPVAVKISSPDITHKTDVGGVELNLHCDFEVEGASRSLRRRAKKAYPDATIHGVTVEAMHSSRHGRELIVGVISDPVFGPVVSFGAGGIAVEVFRDQAIALPPLNEVLIRSLISQTRVARLLEPFRNMPGVDVAALTNLLLRISEMVCELPELAEMDINPLVADENGVIALDARIRLQERSQEEDRYGHMTIAPYPHHLEKTVQLEGGPEVVFRPIRPEDAQIEQCFVKALSEEARYFRFMQSVQELTPRMLVRFTQIDYDREMAFIATTGTKEGETQIAVARYVTEVDDTTCEFAVVVADDWQGRGVATTLMRMLMDEAKSKGLREMRGEVLSYNTHMLDLADRLGFRITTHPEDSALRLIRREL